MGNNSNKIFNRCEGKKIAYYIVNSQGILNFWDEHWDSYISDLSKEYYKSYLKGFLGHGQLKDIFIKFLPRKGLILDAGCGTARYVISLRARGYNCFGIEFAQKTIQKIKDSFPNLPVEKGDVKQLNLKDGSIDAYISLGVVEHFKEGPDKAINEAFRALNKNGIMLVSIPQVFSWRKIQASPENTPLPDNAYFYQYAFCKDEFRQILQKAGFHIEAEYGYHSHYALGLRFKFFRKALNLFPRLALLDLIIDRTFFGKNICRMRLYVARKR